MTNPYKTARCILYRDDRYLLAVHGPAWRRTERRWGIPGGQIERGETPHTAVARELEEELRVVAPALLEIGAFSYKRALHMVFAAPLLDDVGDYDENELLEIGWFTELEVARLKARSALHADYELEAIRRLRGMLAAPRSVPVRLYAD